MDSGTFQGRGVSQSSIHPQRIGTTGYVRNGFGHPSLNSSKRLQNTVRTGNWNHSCRENSSSRICNSSRWTTRFTNFSKHHFKDRPNNRSYSSFSGRGRGIKAFESSKRSGFELFCPSRSLSPLPQEPLLGSEEERQQKISETTKKLKQSLSSITDEERVTLWDQDLSDVTNIPSTNNSNPENNKDLASSAENLLALTQTHATLECSSNEFKDISFFDNNRNEETANKKIIDFNDFNVASKDSTIENKIPDISSDLQSSYNKNIFMETTSHDSGNINFSNQNAIEVPLCHSEFAKKSPNILEATEKNVLPTTNITMCPAPSVSASVSNAPSSQYISNLSDLPQPPAVFDPRLSVTERISIAESTVAATAVGTSVMANYSQIQPSVNTAQPSTFMNSVQINYPNMIIPRHFQNSNAKSPAQQSSIDISSTIHSGNFEEDGLEEMQEAMEFAKQVMSLTEEKNINEKNFIVNEFVHSPENSGLLKADKKIEKKTTASTLFTAVTCDLEVPSAASNSNNEGTESIIKSELLLANSKTSDNLATDLKSSFLDQHFESIKIHDEASWKSRVLNRFLKMSKNEIRNMLNHSSLRKFDIAMNNLVREKKPSLSQKTRINEDEKIKEYDREEFVTQLNAMLDPNATVDISNLPIDFIHHLNEVLQLDPVQFKRNELVIERIPQSDFKNQSEVTSDHINSQDKAKIQNVSGVENVKRHTISNLKNSAKFQSSRQKPSCKKDASFSLKLDKKPKLTDSSSLQKTVMKKRQLDQIKSSKHSYIDTDKEQDKKLVSVSKPKNLVEENLHVNQRFEKINENCRICTKKHLEQKCAHMNASDYVMRDYAKSTESMATPIVNMADIDDIFLAGIAKVRSTSNERTTKDQGKLAFNLDEIFATGIAKGKLCLKSSDETSKIIQKRSADVEEIERWMKKEREHIDAYRNLTKEEWDAKYGKTMDRGAFERELEVTFSEFGKLSALTLEQDEDNDPESSDSEDSSSSCSIQSEDETSSDVQQLLKVIKEREKIAKKKSINETIRDEVAAEIERKWREKNKQKEKKSKRRCHKRKDKKEKKRRVKRKHKRRSRDNDSELEDDLSVKLLTKDEIKKEIKEEPHFTSFQPSSLQSVLKKSKISNSKTTRSGGYVRGFVPLHKTKAQLSKQADKNIEVVTRKVTFSDKVIQHHISSENQFNSTKFHVIPSNILNNQVIDAEKAISLDSPCDLEAQKKFGIIPQLFASMDMAQRQQVDLKLTSDIQKISAIKATDPNSSNKKNCMVVQKPKEEDIFKSIEQACKENLKEARQSELLLLENKVVTEPIIKVLVNANKDPRKLDINQYKTRILEREKQEEQQKKKLKQTIRAATKLNRQNKLIILNDVKPVKSIIPKNNQENLKKEVLKLSSDLKLKAVKPALGNKITTEVYKINKQTEIFNKEVVYKSIFTEKAVTDEHDSLKIISDTLPDCIPSEEISVCGKFFECRIFKEPIHNLKLQDNARLNGRIDFKCESQDQLEIKGQIIADLPIRKDCSIHVTKDRSIDNINKVVKNVSINKEKSSRENFKCFVQNHQKKVKKKLSNFENESGMVTISANVSENSPCEADIKMQLHFEPIKNLEDKTDLKHTSNIKCKTFRKKFVKNEEQGEPKYMKLKESFNEVKDLCDNGFNAKQNCTILLFQECNKNKKLCALMEIIDNKISDENYKVDVVNSEVQRLSEVKNKSDITESKLSYLNLDDPIEKTLLHFDSEETHERLAYDIKGNKLTQLSKTEIETSRHLPKIISEIILKSPVIIMPASSNIFQKNSKVDNTKNCHHVDVIGKDLTNIHMKSKVSKMQCNEESVSKTKLNSYLHKVSDNKILEKCGTFENLSNTEDHNNFDLENSGLIFCKEVQKEGGNLLNKTNDFITKENKLTDTILFEEPTESSYQAQLQKHIYSPERNNCALSTRNTKIASIEESANRIKFDSKESILKRMLEIDLEVRKLMDEKMELHQMLLKNNFRSKNSVREKSLALLTTAEEDILRLPEHGTEDISKNSTNTMPCSSSLQEETGLASIYIGNNYKSGKENNKHSPKNAKRKYSCNVIADIQLDVSGESAKENKKSEIKNYVQKHNLLNKDMETALDNVKGESISTDLILSRNCIQVKKNETSCVQLNDKSAPGNLHYRNSFSNFKESELNNIQELKFNSKEQKVESDNTESKFNVPGLKKKEYENGKRKLKKNRIINNDVLNHYDDAIESVVNRIKYQINAAEQKSNKKFSPKADRVNNAISNCIFSQKLEKKNFVIKKDLKIQLSKNEIDNYHKKKDLLKITAGCQKNDLNIKKKVSTSNIENSFTYQGLPYLILDNLEDSCERTTSNSEIKRDADRFLDSDITRSINLCENTSAESVDALPSNSSNCNDCSLNIKYDQNLSNTRECSRNIVIDNTNISSEDFNIVENQLNSLLKKFNPDNLHMLENSGVLNIDAAIPGTEYGKSKQEITELNKISTENIVSRTNFHKQNPFDSKNANESSTSDEKTVHDFSRTSEFLDEFNNPSSEIICINDENRLDNLQSVRTKKISKENLALSNELHYQKEMCNNSKQKLSEPLFSRCLQNLDEYDYFSSHCKTSGPGNHSRSHIENVHKNVSDDINTSCTETVSCEKSIKYGNTPKPSANKTLKRKNFFGNDNLLACKVRLIDCKYTYLQPNVSSELLMKAGISRIKHFSNCDNWKYKQETRSNANLKYESNK